MIANKSETILIICNGNIHRSVVAEHCINKAFKEKGIDNELVAVSRGLQGTMETKPPTGKNLKDYSIKWSISGVILQELGIDISDAQSTPVDLLIVERALFILVMDRGVLIDRPNSMAKQFPKYGYKMRLFRELEGRTEDVKDCGDSDDPKLHREVIELIQFIVTERFNDLINYTKLFTERRQDDQCQVAS